MIQASPDAISLRSLPERRYIEVNESFTRLTGYTAEEVTGKTLSDINLFVETEWHRNTLEKLQRDGEIREQEFRYRPKGGEIRFATLSPARVMLDGQPCMLSTTRAITARKRTDAAPPHLAPMVDSSQQ